MRTIKIPNCGYSKFNEIRDALFHTIPFAVYNVAYLAHSREAYFSFWDQDYIPKCFLQYVMSPLKIDIKQKLDEELRQILSADYTDEIDFSSSKTTNDDPVIF